MKATEVFEKMNFAGSMNRDFLFGIDFEMDEGFFIANPLSQTEVLFDIKGLTNCKEVPCRDKEPDLGILQSDCRTYKNGFEIVRRGLERGDTFLLNLTARTEVETNLSLKDIFMRSTAPYRIYMPGRFVCFSPESFVRISGNEIFTFPMKGTIDATVNGAEKILMDDYKEICEHYTIVDLMRNDLNSVAEKVEVRRFRYIDRIKTLKGEILQTSSEICGQLSSGWQNGVGDMMRRLLPAGSISGAPKESTVRLICEAEKCKRGFYTGVFGYFDGENLDSAVMIRFIETTDGHLYFRSGGGITINSNCEDEYREVLEKVYLSVK